MGVANISVYNILANLGYWAVQGDIDIRVADENNMVNFFNWDIDLYNRDIGWWKVYNILVTFFNWDTDLYKGDIGWWKVYNIIVNFFNWDTALCKGDIG